MKKIDDMCKLRVYAMPKYEFHFGLAWAPKIFFSQGVNLIYSVANFDTYMDFI
jgi:hypothetical protein